MKRTLIVVLLFFALSSHELFLKSDSHFLKANEAAELFLFNGTFDKSENVITRDRIIDDKIIGPGFDFHPSVDNYYDKEHATYLKFKTGNPGTYVAGVSTLPRTIEMNAQEFKEYLEHEGLSDVLAQRERKGLSSKGAKEKYSKHVKSILQVAETKTGHFSKTFDYPIEFVPLKNPYELSVGDDIAFQLLLDGTPLANQVVHFSSRAPGKEDGMEKSTRTFQNGNFSFKISEKGKWYIATIYITESDEEGIDYESNWATLTFEVK